MKKKSKIKNVYLYIKKEKINSCIKYGMKLSEYSNISFKLNAGSKAGMVAYFSPKDTDKYENTAYDILRISTDELTIYVHNAIEGQEQVLTNNACLLQNYTLGEYISPIVVICSSVLPENIYKYNRIIDVPLLLDTSKEFYLNRQQELEWESKMTSLTFDMLKK